MPVPVSTTHTAGVGLAAHANVAAVTEGPFERTKRLAQERLEQEKKQKSQSQEPVAAAVPLQPQIPAVAQNGHTPTETLPLQPAIAVQDLSFSYPGLGECEPWTCGTVWPSCAPPHNSREKPGAEWPSSLLLLPLASEHVHTGAEKGLDAGQGQQVTPNAHIRFPALAALQMAVPSQVSPL